MDSIKMDTKIDVHYEPLEVLKKRCNDPNRLYHSLINTPKAALISMLLNSENDADPTTGLIKSKELAHCVYCHTVYNKNFNEPQFIQCEIEHYGELVDVGEGDEKMYTCCERTCDYSDFYAEDAEFMDRPEAVTIGPWCWRGIHREREIKPEDFSEENPKGKVKEVGTEAGEVVEEEAEEGEGEDDMQYADGSVEEIRNAVWWRNWHTAGGPTCVKLCCVQEEARRLHRFDYVPGIAAAALPREP